jgi:hypothetical protein
VQSAVVAIESTPVPPLAAIMDDASVSVGAHLTGDGAVRVAELDVHDAALQASSSATSCTLLAGRMSAKPCDVGPSPLTIGLIR